MTAALTFIHNRFALALIVFSVVLGLWGLVAFARSRRISAGFRSSFLLMIALTAVQGLLGLALLLAGQQPRELLHVVYGIFAFLFLPGVYFYAGRDNRPREAAVLTIACWVVAIAFGRGIMTGG